MPLYLTEKDVQQILTMDLALESVENAFNLFSEGQAVNHPRSRTRVGNRVLHFMAASSATLGVMGTKTYGTVGAANRDIQFYIQLISTETGALLAILEASLLGQIRTGAASGIATKFMARDKTPTVGIIGTGYQAVTQLEAMRHVREISSIKVFSRNPERRVTFAKEMASKLGIEVKPVDNGESCVNESDIVITITNSSNPVLLGEWLNKGTHINAAGSNQSMHRELDDKAISKADIITTDDVNQAKIECGELIHAVEHGIKQWQNVRNVGDVVSGKLPGRENENQITLFESQGIALEDIATGVNVYQIAKANGIGTELPK